MLRLGHTRIGIRGEVLRVEQWHIHAILEIFSVPQKYLSNRLMNHLHFWSSRVVPKTINTLLSSHVRLRLNFLRKRRPGPKEDFTPHQARTFELLCSRKNNNKQKAHLVKKRVLILQLLHAT